MSNPKIISKTPVFHTKLFTINEIDVEIAPGSVQKHHSIERDDTVHIVALDTDDSMYLISEYRYNLGREAIEIPAGYAEKGESSLEAAKRELKEETGLTAHKWTSLNTIEMAGGSLRSKIHFFLAQDLEKGATDFDEAERIRLVKMPLKEAVNRVVSGEIYIAAGVIGILLADKLKQEGKI